MSEEPKCIVYPMSEPDEIWKTLLGAFAGVAGGVALLVASLCAVVLEWHAVDGVHGDLHTLLVMLFAMADLLASAGIVYVLSHLRL